MLPECQYKVSKNNCQNLYYLFLKYKKLKYDEFILKINEEMNKKYDLNDLRKYILHIRKNHSTSKAQLMEDILNYTLGINKDEKTIENVKERNFQTYIHIKPKEMDPSLIEGVKDAVDLVIKENKPYSQLIENGEVKSKALITKLKKYIKNIDPEKYVEFLKINYELENTSMEEIDQFSQVINYFIKSIENRINTLSLYDPNKDEEKIRNFHVSNEEDLDDYYKNHINRLKGWKIRRLETLLDKYTKVKNIIDTIEENKNLTKFQKLSEIDLKIIKENEPFVYEYYRELLKLRQAYDNHVAKLNSLTDKGKNQIIEEFNKKLLLENNK